MSTQARHSVPASPHTNAVQRIGSIAQLVDEAHSLVSSMESATGWRPELKNPVAPTSDGPPNLDNLLRIYEARMRDLLVRLRGQVEFLGE